MKITFSGWSRKVFRHRHDIIPVRSEKNRLLQVKSQSNLIWDSPWRIYGRIENLALTGNFVMQIGFSKEDMIGWLKKLVEEEPNEALNLIATVHADALSAAFDRVEKRLGILERSKERKADG